MAKISPALQIHPDVLEVRWVLLAEQKRWTTALEIARALLKHAPQRPSGWLHQAYSLRRASKDGIEKAWNALVPAYEKFPREPTISYNLSCYACQMRRLDEARVWLRRALKIGGKDKIKRLALEDPDLKVLWGEIRGL